MSAPNLERLGLFYDRIPADLTPEQAAQAAALIPPLPPAGSYGGRIRLRRGPAIALLAQRVVERVAAWGSVTRDDLLRDGWSAEELDALWPAVASRLNAAA